MTEAVLVSSGTAAIHCALAALGIGPGDEVLVPSLSVVMSVAPILYQGATPVFVDSSPGQIDFDYDDLERKLTPRVKAVLPVYMWGRSYDMHRLARFAGSQNIAIVEDACQAHGSIYDAKLLGTWGDLGCFSMQDGKLLSTGEGGFVLTNNTDLADACRRFRTHWANPAFPDLAYQRLGHNYRITAFQAHWARMQVPFLAEIVRRRRDQASHLLSRLDHVNGVSVYRDGVHEEANGYCPVLLTAESLPARLIAVELARRGVPNSVGTFGLRPCQAWDMFQKSSNARVRKASRAAFTPNAERLLDRVLAIILTEKQSHDDLDRIAHVVRSTLDATMRATGSH